MANSVKPLPVINAFVTWINVFIHYLADSHFIIDGLALANSNHNPSKREK